MIARAEKPEDISRIYQINIETFSTDAEANLVDMLREHKVPLISWVAEDKGELIGHILFSPVTLVGQMSRISMAGLGPMAVRPSHQKKGVGTMLVEAGLKQCLKEGYSAVVVLGYPEYYPRFGFVPSVAYGIDSTYDVPPEVFMVKELKKGALKGIQGTVSYHGLFNDV
ncbi:MAG: N-acetyltransferase [Proteobacteria bacterium]|nr:N-acetyltransferase [Pseudomonadota bacterium]